MSTPHEVQFLRADLAQVRRLAADARLHDDVIAGFQYEQRAGLLEQKLALAARKPPGEPGSP